MSFINKSNESLSRPELARLRQHSVSSLFIIALCFLSANPSTNRLLLRSFSARGISLSHTQVINEHDDALGRVGSDSYEGIKSVVIICFNMYFFCSCLDGALS